MEERNEDVRQEMGVEKKLSDRLDQSVLGWFRHMERMSDEPIVKSVWSPEVIGVRSRGGPRMRWSSVYTKALCLHRKAIKATAVLFPLLGITNLLFAVNPGDRGELEGAYMVTNAFLQSSQGVFVSVLYCFLNSEVQELLKKRWRQHRLRRMGYPANQRRKSTKSTIILPSTFSPRTSPQTPHRGIIVSNNTKRTYAVETTAV
ncbi:Corticotropin-releasing factor receptor 1 [Halocaridina rubra]|uniref:Corticotropin-releasing factor receptor 1 n=1 Tax=Halocaridina rubra TaxID=373956 RepID=A0AAN8XHY3_HALRR